MSKVEQFIAAALKYNGDKYSQAKRMEKGYSDCSSLIYKGLRDSGHLTNAGTTISTLRIKNGDPRFREVPKSDLKRGDILWGGNYVNGNWEGHVAIYMGGGKTFEAVKAGVKYMTNRAYFTKVYRIIALEEKVVAKAPTYAKIYVMNKEAKISGFVENGTTYILTNNLKVPVRKFFEELGFKVEFKNKAVYVS